MGRSEKEVSHLRNRMNELNEQFKAGKISSMQFGAEMGKLEKELNGVAKQSS